MEDIGSEEDINKLLVFGYECKIFRDDEKASWVENEKHLIPCMSDPSVLVDRYDCRGALMDVKKYEPKPGDSNYLKHLSPKEIQIEKMCDEERFRDCQKDDFDDTEYQEEEFKRLQMAIGGDVFSGTGPEGGSANYSAMGYVYDAVNDLAKADHSQSGAFVAIEKKSTKRDQPYTQPLGLYIPHDLILPKTMKSHAIIEKTAKFIASHGAQMEIILKTKQATNSQFNFLNYSDELNAYYKYLVTAIRTNAYKPQTVASQDDSSSDENAGSGDGHESPEHNDSYLHPSLVNKPAEQIAQNSPSLYNYKPAANSSYSMLVSKIQEVTYTPPVEEPSLQPQYQYGVSNPEMIHGYDIPYAQDQGYLAYQAGEHPAPGTQMPPPDDLIIIEKMANYVIKNGPAFESLATTKGDPRFQFLDPRSPYHWYYLCCKEHYRVESSAVVASDKFVAYTDGRKVESESRGTLSEAETKFSTSTPATHRTQVSSVTSPSLFDVPPKPAPPDHANAVTRMSTLPPELISKIEELRKRTMLNKMKQNAGTNDTTVVPTAHFPGSTALLPRKENIIKFSASIAQKFKTEDDVEERLELGVKNGSTMKDDEASRQRKEERRRKAAIFLQKLKATEALTAVGVGATLAIDSGLNNGSKSPVEVNLNAVEKTQPLAEAKERVTPPPVNHVEKTSQEDPEAEDEVSVLTEQPKSHRPMELAEAGKRKSRKRSRHSSFTEEEFSTKDDIHRSSKKKKSKHSKKKKKDDKDKDKHHHRSHSHSKKSKKKRR